MKEILKRFDVFEKKLESELGGLRTDVISRMAELEMRVTPALLDAVRSNQELASELPQQRLARDERIEALIKRIEALEARVG